MENKAERLDYTWQEKILTKILGRINNFYDTYLHGDERPAFFDKNQICPELSELDANYQTIRDELENVLQQEKSIPNYHDLDSGQYRISSEVDATKHWKIFVLYSFGCKPLHNRSLCPKTTALIDKIPNLNQAFFSILAPGKSIPAHCGPYHGSLRYHLGLIVPQTHSPSIRVKNTIYTWKEGESMMFDDSYEHEVYNKSFGMRVILLIDIIRPMPWLPNIINRSLTYLAGHAYGRMIKKNLTK